MKNEMKNEIVHPIDNGLVITNEVIVSCCGCNHEERITREAADEWTDTDWFQCHECE
jgi:hypothetical protein